MITVEINFGTSCCQYKSGDEVTIWYDKNNPEYSYIDGYKEDGVSSVVCFLLGSIAVFCGLLVIVLVWII